MFDTGYHSNMAPHVYRYAVPSSWYHQHGVRRYPLSSLDTQNDHHDIITRYGFHGTSHDYVVRRAASVLGAGARVVR